MTFLKRPHLLVLGAVAATLGLATSRAFAQSPSVTDVDPARAQFELGVAAMQREAWPDALTAFETSMRLRRSAAVALDLSVVLHRLGRLAEARAWLQEFSELASPAQHRTHDAEAAGMLADIARRLARLRVLSLSPVSAVVFVDGRRAQLNEAGEAVVDPGAHTVRAEAPGYIAHESQVEIAPGGTGDVRVSLEHEPVPVAPVVVTPTVVASPHPVGGDVAVDPRVAPSAPVTVSPPFYTRWWFWTAIGAAVVGGAAASVVVATSGTRPLPDTSTHVTLNATTRAGAM